MLGIQFSLKCGVQTALYLLMGCCKNHLQGCSKSGYFHPRATEMVPFPDQTLNPKALSSEPSEYNPSTAGNAGYLPQYLSPLLPCRIPVVTGHTEICRENIALAAL